MSKPHQSDEEIKVPSQAGTAEEHGAEVIEVDTVDVEQFGRDNKIPPPARKYRVKIDREHYVFEMRIVTGREVLEKAGRVPVQRFELEMGVHGAGFVPVGYDEKIDLGKPGIEVFQTFPLDEQEG